MTTDDLVKIINVLQPIAVAALGLGGALLTRWTVPRVRELRSELAKTNKRYTRLGRAYQVLVEHIDDLYRALEAEDVAVQRRILRRLRTTRPAVLDLENEDEENAETPDA